VPRAARSARRTAEEEEAMDLIQLVVILILVGVLLWLVNTYLPMDAQVKQILNVVVLIAVVLWIMTVFGLLPLGHRIRVGPE
jgi:hypothetical protein